MTPAFLKQTTEGVQLAIKVQPRASRQEIAGVHGSELKVCVTAPPVDAAANRALTDFLAEICDLPRSTVKLLRGQTSRHKIVLLNGASLQAVLDRLQPYLD